MKTLAKAFAITFALVMVAGTAAATYDPTRLAEPKAPLDAGLDPSIDDPVVPYLYRNWFTGTEELQRLARENPDRARLHSIGKSWRGLDLWVIEITNFDSDSPPLAERPVLWFDGNTHGNEQLGGELAFEIANFLLTEYDSNETAKWIVDNRHVYILPIVNPDGNLQDSRFNARGVNINRNWPAGWGGVGTSNMLFNNPGPYPASEPETKAIIDFLSALPKRVDYFQSFHTGIVLWLYPWGFTEELPPDDKMFSRVCVEAFPGDERCGPTYTTIYPASGVAVDWAYHALGASSWTYEVSNEQFMPGSLMPLREQLSEAWGGTMHALVNVHKYGAHLVLEGLDIRPLGDGKYDVRATLRNDGYGDVQWADVELSVTGSRVPGSVRVTNLEAAETRTVVMPVYRLDAIDESGSLDLKLSYPKRVWREPMTTEVLSLPLKPGAGLEIADDVLGLLDVSYAEEITDRFLPVAHPIFVLVLLGGAAWIRRRG